MAEEGEEGEDRKVGGGSRARSSWKLRCGLCSIATGKSVKGFRYRRDMKFRLEVSSLGLPTSPVSPAS